MKTNITLCGETPIIKRYSWDEVQENPGIYQEKLNDNWMMISGVLEGVETGKRVLFLHLCDDEVSIVPKENLWNERSFIKVLRPISVEFTN